MKYKQLDIFSFHCKAETETICKDLKEISEQAPLETVSEEFECTKLFFTKIF